MVKYYGGVLEIFNGVEKVWSQYGEGKCVFFQ